MGVFQNSGQLLGGSHCLDPYPYTLNAKPYRTQRVKGLGIYAYIYMYIYIYIFSLSLSLSLSFSPSLQVSISLSLSLYSPSEGCL